jgi:enoyl-CoA hydratase
MAALLITESVNQTQDNMRIYNSLNACFSMRQLNQSYWMGVHGVGCPSANESDGVPIWRQDPPIAPAVKNRVRAEKANWWTRI